MYLKENKMARKRVAILVLAGMISSIGCNKVLAGMISSLGCKKGVNDSLSSSGTSDYFPLQVGNSWVFEKYDLHDSTHSPMGTFSIQVVDTTSIADATYFLVTQDWYEIIPDTVYARKEGDKVFWRLKGRDWLVYDFAAPQGSSWGLPLPYCERFNDSPVRVHANALSEEGYDEGIGTDPNKRYFGFEPPWIEGAWYEVYLADVGPVFIKWYPTEMEAWDIGRLKEAHVGGKVISGDDIVTSVSKISFGHLKTMFKKGR